MAKLDALDRLTRGPLRSRSAQAQVSTRAGSETLRLRPTPRSASSKRPEVEGLEPRAASLPRATSSINPRPPMVIVRERVVDRPSRRERPQVLEPRLDPGARPQAKRGPGQAGVSSGQRASALRTIERVERLRTVERVERIERTEKIVERPSARLEPRRTVPVRGSSRGSRRSQPLRGSQIERPRISKPVRRRSTQSQNTRPRPPLRPSGSASTSVERKQGRERKALGSPTVAPAKPRAVVEARRAASDGARVRVEGRTNERGPSERERRPADASERRPAARPSKAPPSKASSSATPRPPTIPRQAPADSRREPKPKPAAAKPVVRPQPARPSSARKSTSKAAARQLGVRISIAHVEIRAQTRERKPSRSTIVTGPRAHSITPRLFGAV